ncbi:signal peptidase I [Neobacillus sp. 3P2-tot-E-2]|uniref:signal peptidase I n=1 Tax=Neobacillus sp. 3P2-tot-E-2 TaxID=3132212 RepID=UPI0039A34E4A
MRSTESEKVENNTVTAGKKNGIKEMIKFIAGLFVVYIIVSNTIGTTKVIGHSMDRTLKDGSFLFINKLSTFFSKPSHGDVVIIKEEDLRIVKRVIGIPGDTVSIQGGVLYINNEPVPENYVLGTSNDMSPVTVEKGEVFIMGDNRAPGESLDSRDPKMGTISVEHIEGYAVVSLYPFYTIKK